MRGEGNFMKYVLIVLLLLILINSLYSSTIIDSLENKLKIVVAEEKIKVLNSLSKEYLYISPEQSIIYGVQTSELAIKFHDDKHEHEAYNNIANSYALLKDYDESIIYLEKALKKSEQIGQVDIILIDIYRTAEVYSCSNNHTKSIEFYNKALRINEIINNRSEVALVLNRIGLEYKKAGQYKKASDFFIRALRFEEENVRVLMRDEYEQISEFYTSIGQDEKALEYYKLFSTIKDTIASTERSHKIHDMQNRYEDEQRQRKIELLRKETEIADLKLQQLLLQQEKQEKNFEARERIQQIEALTTEKELNETKLKVTQYEKENIQEEMLSYQKDKEIRDLELKNKAIQIKTQNFTQKALISAIAVIMIFAFVGFYLAFTNSATNRALNIANTKLEQIAKTDPLTSLSNRRDMIEKMEHEQKRFGRNGKSFVLLMADIDDFKKINDDNGHDCGDFILESLARQMKSSARKQDITGRWGGEEFLMLLPETDIDGGFALADKIRKDIEVTSYVFSETKLDLTLTFGVSVYDRPMDIDRCIKMADEALYRGKKQGKNCVVMTRPKDKPIIIGLDKSAESV